MPLIDLSTAPDAIYHAGEAIDALYYAGETLWQKPVTIASLYGTGAGQVPMHITSGLVNLGGGGATYAPTPAGAIVADGDWLDMDAAGNYAFTAIELVGKRLFLALDNTNSKTAQWLWGGGTNTYGGIIGSTYPNDGFRVVSSGTSRENKTGLGAGIGQYLLEVQFLADRVGVWLDGVLRFWLVGSSSHAISRIGSHVAADTTGNGFDGRIGDAVVLVTDGTHLDQIATIRAHYAAKYPALRIRDTLSLVADADHGVQRLTYTRLGNQISLAGLVAGDPVAANITITPPATATRYDVIYRASDGAIAVAQGAARSSDPEVGQPALPPGAVPLLRTRTNTAGITSVSPLAPMIGGIHHAYHAEAVAQIAAARAGIPNTLAKIRAGQPVRIIGLGDSITAVQSSAGVETTFDGPTRDMGISGKGTGYLDSSTGSLQADYLATIPQYTAVQIGRADDGAGQVHTKVGWNWELVTAIEELGLHTLGSNLWYSQNAIAGRRCVDLYDATGTTPDPWLTTVGDADGDLVVLGLGSNDRATLQPVTDRLTKAVNYLKGRGKEIVLVEVPRPVYEPTSWRRVNAEIRSAAVATGVGVIPLSCLYEDGAYGGIGVNAEDRCAANNSEGSTTTGNHPGPHEFAEMRKLMRALVAA